MKKTFVFKRLDFVTWLARLNGPPGRLPANDACLRTLENP
jgi:hypothetical protein